MPQNWSGSQCNGLRVIHSHNSHSPAKEVWSGELEWIMRTLLSAVFYIIYSVASCEAAKIGASRAIIEKLAAIPPSRL